MLIQEIKESFKKGKSISGIVEIKPYLSYVEKKILCDKIIEESLEQNENGLFLCNFFNKKIAKDISIIVNFTNIEFEQTIQDYDYLSEQGIVDYVLNNMNQNDKVFIDEMVDKNIEQRIKLFNSIEGILANKMDKLIEKLPNDKQIKSLLKSLVKDLNKFDWDKIPMLKEIWKNANGGLGDGDGK